MPIFREQVGLWLIYNANMTVTVGGSLHLIKYNTLIIIMTSYKENCGTSMGIFKINIDTEKYLKI